MKRKFKILYISHSPYFNGAEICLLTLVKIINKDLFEPIVVFPAPGPLVEEMKSIGVKTYISPIERWIRFGFEKPVRDSNMSYRVQMIARIIDEEAIDLVHTNSSVVLEGAIAAKYKNVPHVWHIHEFLKEHPELSSCLPLAFVYEIISYLSKKIVCVSDFTKSQFEPIAVNDKLTTIYNGVEINENFQEYNFLRSNLGIKDNELIAVVVGLLTEAKGYQNLLETASLIRKKGNNTKFVWIGGSSKKNLRNFNLKIRNSGLKNSVTYLGFRKDIQAILRCSDLLISPSIMENLSLSILEAMAAGLPVIATDCGGTYECVVNGQTGFIVPVNDSIKLSEKIIEISYDEKKRKMFGENGFTRFLNNFSANVYVEKFENLYSEILDGRELKPISTKEKMLMDSFLQVYDVISKNHWKVLKMKNKNIY